MPLPSRLSSRQVIRLAQVPCVVVAALLLHHLKIMSVRSFALLLIIVLVVAEAFIPDHVDEPKPDQ